MSNSRNNFVFGSNFSFNSQNMVNENVFSEVQDSQAGPFPPVSGSFLLLNGTNFKLLNGTNLLLL